MGVRQRAWVTAVEHEVEPQHSRLDNVRIDQFLLAHEGYVLAGRHSRSHVEITSSSAQAVHCITRSTLTHYQMVPMYVQTYTYCPVLKYGNTGPTITESSFQKKNLATW